ncbi:unnamed protein product [Auanema sp. JU1783]|nr:unnamed protein product [Auanema sp. JU1783]
MSVRTTLHVFRLIFAIIWCYSLYFDVKYQPRLGHEYYIYKLVMLTNINFVLLTVFSVIAALGYFFNTLHTVRSFMFYTSAFPLGTITCSLFWGLYYIDPELVMPSWVARLIPSWLNHVTHTLPISQLIFEMLSGTNKPSSRRTNIISSAFLVAVYFIIILVTRAVDGYWIYPLLELFAVHHFLLGYILAVLGYYSLILLAQKVSKISFVQQRKLNRGGRKKQC